MLALEKCRVMVGCRSGAHFPSFLARDIRDGRLGVPVNRYTARLLVRDANTIIARFGPTASVYLRMGRRLDDHQGGGEDSGDGPDGFPLASSTLLVLSLRSSLLPVPMASAPSDS